MDSNLRQHFQIISESDITADYGNEFLAITGGDWEAYMQGAFLKEYRPRASDNAETAARRVARKIQFNEEVRQGLQSKVRDNFSKLRTYSDYLVSFVEIANSWRNPAQPEFSIDIFLTEKSRPYIEKLDAVVHRIKEECTKNPDAIRLDRLFYLIDAAQLITDLKRGNEKDEARLQKFRDSRFKINPEILGMYLTGYFGDSFSNLQRSIANAAQRGDAKTFRDSFEDLYKISPEHAINHAATFETSPLGSLSAELGTDFKKRWNAEKDALLSATLTEPVYAYMKANVTL